MPATAQGLKHRYVTFSVVLFKELNTCRSWEQLSPFFQLDASWRRSQGLHMPLSKRQTLLGQSCILSTFKHWASAFSKNASAEAQATAQGFWQPWWVPGAAVAHASPCRRQPGSGQLGLCAVSGVQSSELAFQPCVDFGASNKAGKLVFILGLTTTEVSDMEMET